MCFAESNFYTLILCVSFLSFLLTQSSFGLGCYKQDSPDLLRSKLEIKKQGISGFVCLFTYVMVWNICLIALSGSNCLIW